MDAEDFGQVLAAVREFVRKEVVPSEAEIDERDEIPAGIREKAAGLGLFGWALPEEYGGLGLGMAEDVRLAIELGYTTPAFRSLFGTNNGIAGQAIVAYGTPDQRTRWLPRLAAGQAIASFALTEAEAGSDPSGLTSRAVRDGEIFRLNGVKRFITNAPLAELFVVFARTEPGSTGRGGISALLVPAGSKGVTVGPHDKKMGQAGAWTAEVFFDDVEVPVSALVGEEGQGYRIAMASLARGRLHIAALCVGMAERALGEAVAYARTARQGGGRSANTSWCRRCWPNRTPSSPPGARWCTRPPRRTTRARTASSARPRRSCSARRCSAAWPTGRCRCTAAPVTCAASRSSGSTATRGCSGSTRAPAKSRSWSSPVSCCGSPEPAG